jgi:endo-1,4-beta-D-glucanase Y
MVERLIRTSPCSVFAMAFVLGGCDIGQTSAHDEFADEDAATSASGSGGANAGGNGSVVPTGGSSAGGSSAEGGTDPMMAAGYNGYTASTVSVSDATAAYDRFKSKYIEDCGNGEMRVATNGQETVSEGIGYGLLLAVGHNDRAVFDGLWNYYKSHRDGNGLMNWKISGCTTSTLGQNAATDADLDAAMALVQADCRWTGYSADANTLIDAIHQNETANIGGTSVIKPGDVWGGAGCTNPSYFSPGYYRVFAQVQPDQASFWNAFADDSYTVLERAANASTGLVPDWTDTNGTAGGSSDGCPKSANYTYDAARTPWRIATDYVWWGTPRAKTWLDRVTDFIDTSGGIYQVGDGYALDGTRLSQNHNSTFTGAFALAAMAHSQARADDFMTGFVAISTDSSYFQEALRAVYLLLATGLFTPGCG